MRAALVSLVASLLFVPSTSSGIHAQTPAQQSSPEAATAPQQATPLAPAQPAQPAEQAAPAAEPVLRQIYDAAYRINDLLSTLTPANWKMDDAARKSFDDTLASVHNGLKSLEERRYKFSGQTNNTSLGRDVASALEGLRPDLDILVGDVGTYQNAGDATPFRQSEERLLGLEQPLNRYLASLGSPASPPAGQPPVAVTEVQKPATTPPATSPPAEAALTAEQSKPAAEKPNTVGPTSAQSNAPAPPTPAPAVSTAVTPPPGQTPVTASSTPPLAVNPQILARQIYDAAFRVIDLISTLTPANWKIDEAGRKSLDDTLNSVRSQLKTLEERRYKFSGQTNNAGLGRDVASAMESLRPDLDILVGDVTKFQEADAAPFQQAEERLLGLVQPLNQYIAALESPVLAPAGSSAVGSTVAKSAVPETEQIAAPTAAPPPSTTLLLTGAVTPQQIKDLVHEIYVASFRIKDLLSVVNPAGWKASDEERQSLQDELQQVHERLKALDEARTQLSQQNESLPAAFATYKEMPPVINGLNQAANGLTQYQGGDLGGQLKQAAGWLAKSRDTLASYFEQILKRRWDNVQSYETNLASCQNRLNYAMYGRTAPAEPMTNIMPVLLGRHVHHADQKAGKPEAKAAGGTGPGSSTAKPAVGNSKGPQSSRRSRQRHHSRPKANKNK